MIISVNLNIQKSTTAILNIEGVLFDVGLNVQASLPITLIR